MHNTNLKPTTNQLVVQISKECFEWWKRYNKYNNASTDKNLHFSDAVWSEILSYTDNKDGSYHIGTFDALYNKYPCEFTYNMLSAFLLELQARDQGAYKTEENIRI